MTVPLLHMGVCLSLSLPVSLYISIYSENPSFTHEAFSYSVYSTASSPTSNSVDLCYD